MRTIDQIRADAAALRQRAGVLQHVDGPEPELLRVGAAIVAALADVAERLDLLRIDVALGRGR